MKYLSILFVAFLSLSGSAQDSKREKIEAYKVAYFTERLELSPAEAQKFWPVYNAHSKKREEINHREDKEVRNAMKGKQPLSDSDARQILKSYITIEEEEFLARKSLVNDLEKILPPSKIVKVIQTEHEFRRHLFHKLRNRKDGRP